MDKALKKSKIKFNFFDILILMIITFAIVLSVYLTVMSEKDVSMTQTDGFKYELKVDKLDNDFLSMMSVGDLLYEYESGKEIGRVVDLRISDCLELVKKEDTTEYKKVVGYSTVQITVDCSGLYFEDEGGIMNISVNEYTVRVGTDVKVRNSKLLFDAEFHLSGEGDLEK